MVVRNIKVDKKQYFAYFLAKFTSPEPIAFPTRMQAVKERPIES